MSNTLINYLKFLKLHKFYFMRNEVKMIYHIIIKFPLQYILFISVHRYVYSVIKTPPFQYY